MSSGSEVEADSDADNVFLPTRANNPSSPKTAQKETCNEKTKAIPKTLNLGR